MEKKKDYTWIIYVVITIILILLVWIGVYYIDKDRQKRIDFYKEWCPKLNSTIVEPIEGYVYHARCFKEFSGEIKYYWVTETNGNKYLMETS